MEKDQQDFKYTYSAKQQEEIKSIRQRYLPAEEDKMEQLRKLDESTKMPGTIMSLAVGTIGALLLGLGMACIFVWTHLLALGIVMAVIGAVGVALAFPLFIHLAKRQREKVASQVLQLSEELMRK